MMLTIKSHNQWKSITELLYTNLLQMQSLQAGFHRAYPIRSRIARALHSSPYNPNRRSELVSFHSLIYIYTVKGYSRDQCGHENSVQHVDVMSVHSERETA